MSLLYGLVAAVAWAVHDICVRFVSQKTSILPALLAVLVCGLLLVAPVAALTGEWGSMTPSAFGLSGLSGIAFGLGSFSLYGAFVIGPVRLVAPIIGAYPVLSVGWGALSGAPVTGLQWLAVMVVVAGVALVAILSDTGERHDRTLRAVILSLLAACGFALTFAAGQAATRHGAELPVILVTRLAAATTIVLIMLLYRQPYRVKRSVAGLLFLMGMLDATALGLVVAAGSLPRPEFAAVASSLFGMLTVVLAWAILKESMTRAQWAAVIVVFAGIAYLGN